MHQVDQLEEEIDWTHFTFQHGFRQLPQHLLQQLHHPLTSLPPSVTPDPDVKMSEASQSPSPSPLGQLPAAMQHPATIKPDPSAATVPAASGLELKLEPGQRAQQDSPTEQSRQAEAEHAVLRSDDTREMAGDIGMAAEGEEGQGSDGEGGAEGQRLTRSRRGNAAGLYMLDHGSQLIPKKVAHLLPNPFTTLPHINHDCSTGLGLPTAKAVLSYATCQTRCAHLLLCT